MEYFAALAPILAALIGEAAAAGDDERAEALRQQAMAELGIEVPSVEEFKATALESKAVNAHDPAAQSSRLDALRLLQERSAEGYNDTDKAAINDTLSDVNQRERGQRMAITQGMDPNSGAAIAAQLSNQQAGAQRANSQGLAIAGQSRANAMRALMAQGDLAGSMEDDAFRRGQAGDAMAQFNQRNSMDAATFNAAQRQQQFGNKFNLANARAAAMRGDAGLAVAAGNQKRQTAAGIGQSVQDGLGGLSDLEEERRKKKNGGT